MAEQALGGKRNGFEIMYCVWLAHNKLCQPLGFDLIKGCLFKGVWFVLWITGRIFGNAEAIAELVGVLTCHLYGRDDRHCVHKFVARNFFEWLDNTVEFKGHFVPARFGHTDYAVSRVDDRQFFRRPDTLHGVSKYGDRQQGRADDGEEKNFELDTHTLPHRKDFGRFVSVSKSSWKIL